MDGYYVLRTWQFPLSHSARKLDPGTVCLPYLELSLPAGTRWWCDIITGLLLNTLIRARIVPCDPTHAQSSRSEVPQRLGLRLLGGRDSVSNGSGASPSPKLASRWVNCERSPVGATMPGSSTASAFSPGLRTSSGSGVSCSDSLGIQCQLPLMSSVGVRELALVAFKDSAVNLR